MKLPQNKRSLANSIEVRHCLLVLCLLPYTVYGACSPEENKKMQTEYTECTSLATTKYQSTLEEDGDKEKATCTLFETFIEECGQTWSQCHSEEDIRKMKDMQIQALLGQYVDSGLVQLDDCPIVNQYWESEDNYEGSGAGCSDKAYIQTQTKFQACSHTVSKDVYQQFQGVEDLEVVGKSICDAIYNISTTCPTLLKTCFGPMDVKQMVKVHLKEIKSYLINLSNLQISVDSLNNCTIPEFSGEVQEYEYYYEEYEDEGIPTDVDSEHQQQNNDNNNADSIQKLLKDHKAEQPADQPAEQYMEQQPNTTPTKSADKGTVRPAPEKTRASHTGHSSSLILQANVHFIFASLILTWFRLK